MINNSQSKYKWYILALATATHMLVAAAPEACMPVLFAEIASELGLSLVQTGIVWGMFSLSGMFVGLIGGSISDRYGVKRTLSVACLLAGVAGALRGLSGGFFGIAATMFLIGLLTMIISVNVHKTASVWFSGRQLGMANGILAAGMGVGFTLGAMISATVLSPLLGGWRNVLFLYGGISIVISLIWFLTGREPTQVEAPHSAGTVPLRQSLSQVVRLKKVWLLALTHLCFQGCFVGVVGYLPLHLRGVGWIAAGADGALAALSGASTLAVIPLALLSDRIGLRKAILLPAILITMVSTSLLTVINGPMVWLLVILVGMVHDGYVAILTTTAMETRGVGTRYAGTAVGLVFSVGRLGGFISPPLGNSLADINPGSPFILWAALAAVAFLLFLFVEETGWRRASHP